MFLTSRATAWPLTLGYMLLTSGAAVPAHQLGKVRQVVLQRSTHSAVLQIRENLHHVLEPLQTTKNLLSPLSSHHPYFNLNMVVIDSIISATFKSPATPLKHFI